MTEGIPVPCRQCINTRKLHDSSRDVGPLDPLIAAVTILDVVIFSLVHRKKCRYIFLYLSPFPQLNQAIASGESIFSSIF